RYNGDIRARSQFRLEFCNTRPWPRRSRPALQAGMNSPVRFSPLGGLIMRSGIRVRLPLLIVLALALALTACSGVGGAGGSPNGDTIVFGAPISLTGSLTKEGSLTRDGYEIWKDTYNAA